MNDPVLMVCPSCNGTAFTIEFKEAAIPPSGPVLMKCRCGNEWDGELMIRFGRVHGPCCTDGYDEET